RVSAYPSLLVLGPGGENIHRWSGFKKAVEFVEELRDARRRAELFAKGEAWDAPRARPHGPFSGDGVTARDAIRGPSDEVPGGIVRIDGELFVAQGRTVFVLDPKDGAVRRRLALAAVPQDLDTDGASLLVLDANWTMGEPVLRLDPDSGEVIGTIPAP